MPEQDHMSPTKEEISLLIDNALLKNNEVQLDKFTKVVESKITPTVGTVVELSQKVGSLETRLINLWAKVAGLTAVGTVLGGAIGAAVVVLWTH